MGPNHASKAAAKKAVIIAADAMRVSAAYRLLHRDNGRELPVVTAGAAAADLRGVA